MAKPIFIIGLPSQTTREAHEETLKNIENKEGLTEDYHVVCYINPNSQGLRFSAFYEKDFDEVKFEELKQFIQDEMQYK